MANNPILMVKPGKVIPIDSVSDMVTAVHRPTVADKNSVDQRVIGYIAMLSNCNVAVQHFVSGMYAMRFRLFCNNCKKSQEIDGLEMLQFVSASEPVREEVIVFCEAHRHGPAMMLMRASKSQVAEPEGRKYREEE